LSLGRPGMARRLLRGGAPARAARRQVRRPDQVRTGCPPPRPRELATREQPVASATRAMRGCRPVPRVYGSGRPAFSPPTVLRGRAIASMDPHRGTGAHFKDGTCTVQGEERSLNRHRESLLSPGTCQERFASLRDGLRPHLTEPVRQVARAGTVPERSGIHGHRTAPGRRGNRR
jgi:hypothetical protein